MQWESLVLKNGIVYRNFVRPDGTIQYRQLLTPRSLRKEVIDMVHAGAAGHLGVRKTREQVQKPTGPIGELMWSCIADVVRRAISIIGVPCRGKDACNGCMLDGRVKDGKLILRVLMCLPEG